MVSGGVQVEGLRDVIRSISKFEGGIADLKSAFLKIGQNVTNEAQSRVPKKSGALAASIKPSKTKNKSIIRAGSAKVPYAGVINYGWPQRNIEPVQYLNKAIEAKEPETIQILDDELGNLIRKFGLK